MDTTDEILEAYGLDESVVFEAISLHRRECEYWRTPWLCKNQEFLVEKFGFTKEEAEIVFGAWQFAFENGEA